MKILHLEDNALKQMAIEKIIRSTGHHEIVWVKTVADGLEEIDSSIIESLL